MFLKKEPNNSKEFFMLVMVSNPLVLNSSEFIEKTKKITSIINVNYQQCNMSLLELLLNRGCYSIASDILKKGANPNINCKNGYPLLFKYAEEGDFASSSVLICNGADINLVNQDGLNFIDIAKRHGNYDYIKYVKELIFEKSQKENNNTETDNYICE